MSITYKITNPCTYNAKYSGLEYLSLHFLFTLRFSVPNTFSFFMSWREINNKKNNLVLLFFFRKKIYYHFYNTINYLFSFLVIYIKYNLKNSSSGSSSCSYVRNSYRRFCNSRTISIFFFKLPNTSSMFI